MFVFRMIYKVANPRCVTNIRLSKKIETLCKRDLRITVARTFYTSKTLRVKIFMEHENQYAFSVMENKGYAMKIQLQKDSDILLKDQFQDLIQEDWSKKSPNEIYDIFPKLGMYCASNSLCISNQIFDKYIDSLTDNIRFANDKELETLFYSLMKWPDTESVKTRNFIEVWAALDDECLKRLPLWSFDKLLKFTALFYFLNIARYSEFAVKTINKLASKSKRLTPAQLVQTLFFVGLIKKSPWDMHNLEVHLCENFTAFTIDDLAIMSMGFFKSKTPIKDVQIITDIMNKIIKHHHEIHEVSLAALLKIIRYSLKLTKDNTLYEMLSILKDEVPRLSIMCCVHLALVGTSTLTLHEQCLDQIAQKANQSIKEARLKDLERLTLAYGIFRYKPNNADDLFKKIIEELKNPNRAPEIARYGRAFACCVSYLGLSCIYPSDLISKVMDPIFLESCYGKHPFAYGREILTLHNTIQIFCNDCKLNGLSDKVVVLMAKKYTDYFPNKKFQRQFNATEKLMLDVMNVLIEGRGPEYVIGDHILTHHQRADLISKVMDPIFLESCYGKHPFAYGREILTLHNTIQIFCNDCKLNSLSDKVVVLMAKKYTDYFPNKKFQRQFNATEKLMLDVMNVLIEGRGPEYVIGDHILTHHQRADIILCNDSNDAPVPVVDVFPKEFGIIKRPPNSNKWIVLVIANRNAIIQNRNILTGPFQQKLRELRTIGYYAGMVNFKDWSLLHTQEEKLNYLLGIIAESVNMK